MIRVWVVKNNHGEYYTTNKQFFELCALTDMFGTEQMARYHIKSNGLLNCVPAELEIKEVKNA